MKIQGPRMHSHYTGQEQLEGSFIFLRIKTKGGCRDSHMGLQLDYTLWFHFWLNSGTWMGTNEKVSPVLSAERKMKLYQLTIPLIHTTNQHTGLIVVGIGKSSLLYSRKMIIFI